MLSEGQLKKGIYSNYFFFLAMMYGLWDLSSLTGNRTLAMAVKAPSPNHWTTREFPKTPLFNHCVTLLKKLWRTQQCKRIECHLWKITDKKLNLKQVNFNQTSSFPEIQGTKKHVKRPNGVQLAKGRSLETLQIARKKTQNGVRKQINCKNIIYDFFVAMPHSFWDLSSPTTDQTCTLGGESAES